MIKFENVHKRYSDGYVALKGVNLECKSGEITVFIGPSGCGKTTTMKLINRLINPTSGKVLVNGKDVSAIDPVELRRGIGYVIQSVGLFPHMTIAENIQVVPRLLKWDKERMDKRVDELLNLVGLEPETYRERYPSELSGGQQQRVGVARALAAEPSVILMDEPFSALDPISREQLQDELIRLQKDIKKTIVFVTHDMDEALKIADKIVLMKDGTVVQQGSPEEILRHPANDFVKEFIGTKRLKQVQEIPTAEEVMIRKPVTTYPTRGLAASIKIMESRKVDTLIVIDEGDKLQGYITIYDVLSQYKDETKRVGDILRPFAYVVGPDTMLTQVIEIVDENKLAYVPVVNEGGTLLGVITRGSLVGHMSEVYPSPGIGV
ncbi:MULTISPECIES: ABC transporter ATP-binding protein [Aneurinibacillus]|jgi:osmoprotectant transport system ATP-binding protein|uniref:Quaternary amine transport ATP-binding protein n=1 Tax=Aneurinibacillus danicus TaxID=267746 RepID=A0A511V6D9_9BACL|nr:MULTISPECIES: betaine/proline/choline family ABC transporter ATP-binding protein [Aneurinibacillus]GEN34527.1 glycine/betaine ABC transporter ATPase [Aneurinibacillus danicus]